MKRFLSLLLLACFALGTVALADAPHASLTYVKKKGHKATHHKAHKADKHKAPKHTA
jgi:Ni/Co efflux regulator RcnB